MLQGIYYPYFVDKTDVKATPVSGWSWVQTPGFSGSERHLSLGHRLQNLRKGRSR